MKDLIEKSRAVEERLRKVGLPIYADTIAALRTALEAKTERADALLTAVKDFKAALEAAQADAARTRNLLKEARKIIRASSSRSITKDWDERATAAIAAQGEKP